VVGQGFPFASAFVTALRMFSHSVNFRSFHYLLANIYIGLTFTRLFISHQHYVKTFFLVRPPI
jgi:hypothetical protein